MSPVRRERRPGTSWRSIGIESWDRLDDTLSLPDDPERADGVVTRIDEMCARQTGRGPCARLFAGDELLPGKGRRKPGTVAGAHTQVLVNRGSDGGLHVTGGGIRIASDSGGARAMMPPPRTHRFRSILCAVDFSRYSAKALRYATALAGACGGRVTAIYAVDPLLSVAAAAAYDSRVLERSALTDLARFVRASGGGRLAAANIRCIVEVGKPAAVVLEQARRLRPSVIVMGTHGRRGARKLFFGSTTEAVLRRFRGPVLAIPPRCRQPGPGWPGGSILAAVDADDHRRAGISAAAGMAEAFGAWLSLVPSVPGSPRAVRGQVQMIIFPLPRAASLRMFRQGSAAYRFVCGARSPVLVLRTGRRAATRPRSSRVA